MEEKKDKDIIKTILEKALNQGIDARTYIPRPFGEKNLFQDVFEVTGDRIKKREYVIHSIINDVTFIENNDYSIFPIGNRRYNYHNDDDIIANIGTMLDLKDQEGNDILLVLQPDAIERIVGNWIHNFSTQSSNELRILESKNERLKIENKDLTNALQDLMGRLKAIDNSGDDSLTGTTTINVGSKPTKGKNK